MERITSENKALKLREAEKQGSTPMHSVGTREGKITNIGTSTEQSLVGFTTAELNSFSTQLKRKQMKDLVAAVESIVNMYCRKEIFPQTKFVTNEWAIKSLQTGYITERK